MTNIDIISQWEPNILRYDVTDPVLGGVDGESVQPLKQLANRTEYLYDRSWFRDVVTLTAGQTIDTSFSFSLIKIEASTNLTFPLADVGSFVKGTVIGFICKNFAPKTHSIIPFGSQQIEDGNVNNGRVWLCDGERLVLVADTDRWQMLVVPANHYLAGEDDLKRRQPRNSLVGQGQLVSRADYARLWAIVEPTAISDILWNSDAFRYKGRYSLGDGSTTFRLPDLRGMFFRALDLGRGVSFGRLDNVAGGYEADDNKAHRHHTFINNGDDFDREALTTSNKPDRRQGLGAGVNNNNYEYNICGGDEEPTLGLNSLSGGTEARPKNIGKTPYIYY